MGILHHYKFSTPKDLLLLDFSPARWGGAFAIAIEAEETIEKAAIVEGW